MGKQKIIWLLAGALCALPGCTDNAPLENTPEAVSAPAGAEHTNSEPGPPDDMNPRTMQMWSRSCALCHVNGNGGAPRVGNAQEWLPRLAQGDDVLMQHTLQGLNNMPPLGYCMACEKRDFAAMIAFMTQGIEPGIPQEQL